MASQDRNTLTQDFVAHSNAMVDVLRGVDRYARARTPLVLVGASGSGKTTLAELIHGASGRSGAFSAHTAGEFDPELERSQIFGHERGASTGGVGRPVTQPPPRTPARGRTPTRRRRTNLDKPRRESPRVRP